MTAPDPRPATRDDVAALCTLWASEIRRREALAALTAEAVDAGTYGQPAPEHAHSGNDHANDHADLRQQLADAIRDAADTHEPACGDGDCECDIAILSPMYGDGPTTRVEGSPDGLADVCAAVVQERIDAKDAEITRLRTELAATEEAASDAGAEYRETKRKLDAMTRWAYERDGQRMAAEQQVRQLQQRIGLLTAEAKGLRADADLQAAENDRLDQLLIDERAITARLGRELAELRDAAARLAELQRQIGA